jgi:tripartite-type tricarboxylate transporter receptor subunit TctC
MWLAQPCIFAAVALVLGAPAACAQNFPNKPIRIVTGSAGGGQDLATRIIAQGLSASWGQPVIVDNRGGSGIVTAEIVSRAPPDGYTLLLAASPHWLLPLLQDNVPYDPVKDFSPVTLALRLPNIVVVNPTLPVASIKELIALAKAKPGALNYGSSGTGASTHLSAELFKAMAGVSIVRVPYKGGGPALTAVLSGEVQIWFPNAAAASAPVKSGKLRALAITSAQPSILSPELPTVAASLPGYESVSMIGIFAQAKTRSGIIDQINREVVRILNTVDVKERLLSTGVETVGSTPKEFETAVKSEMVKWSKVIKDAGIRAE